MEPQDQLVRRLLAGDDQASREFVALGEPVVRRVVGAYAADAAQRDDWTQETFLRLIGGLRRFDGRAPLEHWIAKVALHVCLDELRRQRRERRSLPEVVETRAALDATNAGGVDASKRQADARRLVERLLHQLAPEERLVIQLLDLERRSVKQTAELLDRSESWVKVRAHRARRWLEANCRTWFEELQDG